MKAVAWMSGAAVVSCLLATEVAPYGTAVEILAGMAGPLAAVSVSWAVVERTFKRGPQRLTSVMAKAFGVKLVFFGAYVGVALGVLALKPAPFMVSFTAYFIALYLVEALLLRRLLAGGQTELRSGT